MGDEFALYRALADYNPRIAKTRERPQHTQEGDLSGAAPVEVVGLGGVVGAATSGAHVRRVVADSLRAVAVSTGLGGGDEAKGHEDGGELELHLGGWV